ncbi:uncharacterized protein LOC136745720 [Amia ocellicauda]|uniref:uncharacterized protein LOC136745720 n=1 Tax=Amia ocellicauda TaxID=2972642 RepID=UPI003463B7F4
MGALYSRIYKALFGMQGRVLLLGLDAAGKTTLLYKLKLGEVVSTIPTVGFNVETVEPAAGVSFVVWDVGGQDKIRALWRHYYQNAEGLLFVVDSVDTQRFLEAQEELDAILSHVEMRDVPVVLLANKQDLPGARGPGEVAEALGLHKRRDNPWHAQGCCAVSGEGMSEAMEHLAKMVKQFQSTRGH